MPYNANDPRWNEYHVTPRYLAGTTFTGEPAIRPLLDVGWKMNRDDLGSVYQRPRSDHPPRVYPRRRGRRAVENHRQRQSLRDAPLAGHLQGRRADRDRRRIHHRAGRRLHRSPDAYINHRDGALAALDVGIPLAAAGWSHRFHDTKVSFHSPDHLAGVYLQRGLLDHAAEMQGTRERWLTLAGPPGNRWYATSSSFTPHNLVTAMHTALTDPAPVLRHQHDLRHLPPQATATAVKPRVPTPLDVRRTLAATSRSTALPSVVGGRPFAPAPRRKHSEGMRPTGDGV